MLLLSKLVSIALVVSLATPPWVLGTLATTTYDDHSLPATALSDDALARASGGVYGGRIGAQTAGILELNCGDYDNYLSNVCIGGSNYGQFCLSTSDCPNSQCLPQDEAYQMPNTPFNKFGPCPAPNFFRSRSSSLFPSYRQGVTTPQFAVSATITRLPQYDNPPPPYVKVFLNEWPEPIATITCQRSSPYSSGIAIDATNGNRIDLESWSCPSSNDLAEYVQSIPFDTPFLKKGTQANPAVNILAARTYHNNSFESEELAQDQEVRFFKVVD